MPFSVYGDGIKKILYILNKLFNTADSILLIDEIETGSPYLLVTLFNAGTTMTNYYPLFCAKSQNGRWGYETITFGKKSK